MKEFNQKGGMSSEMGSEEAVGSSRVIKSVFFALLLDLLGFTLILPLLPSILDHYGQTEVSAHVCLSSVSCPLYYSLTFQPTLNLPMIHQSSRFLIIWNTANVC